MQFQKRGLLSADALEVVSSGRAVEEPSHMNCCWCTGANHFVMRCNKIDQWCLVKKKHEMCAMRTANYDWPVAATTPFCITEAALKSCFNIDLPCCGSGTRGGRLVPSGGFSVYCTWNMSTR